MIFVKEIEGYNYEADNYFIGIGENNVVIYSKGGGWKYNS